MAGEPDNGLGGRINTVMQTCFFALSGVLPPDEAIAAIKQAIEKTYGKRGPLIVQKNFDAVDQSLAHLHAVRVPGRVTSTVELRRPVGVKRTRKRTARVATATSFMFVPCSSAR